MKAGLYRICYALVIIGIISPYLLVAFRAGYDQLLLAGLYSIVDLSQPTFVIVVGSILAAIIVDKVSGIHIQNKVLITLIATPILLPSTLFLGFLFISFATGDSNASSLGINLYFSGLAVGALGSPLILGFYQIRMLILKEGDPAVPLALTVVISASLSLMALALDLELGIGQQLDGLSVFGLQILQAVITSILALSQMVTGMGSGFGSTAFSMASSGAERIIIGLFFSLTAIAYYLGRVYMPHQKYYTEAAPAGMSSIPIFTPFSFAMVVFLAALGNYAMIYLIDVVLAPFELALIWTTLIAVVVMYLALSTPSRA